MISAGATNPYIDEFHDGETSIDITRGSYDTYIDELEQINDALTD